MRRNYQAWEIELEKFPKNGSLDEKIIFLLSYAILAPSSHNTQPWQFKIHSNFIDVYPNLERKLLISDPEYRELFISLGCCIQNLLFALSAFRVEYSTEFITEKDNQVTMFRIRILYDFFDIKNAEKDDKLNIISHRNCNRSKHIINKESEELIQKIAEKFDTSNNCRLKIIMEDEKREKLGEISAKGTFLAMSNRKFREELSKWIKNNYTRSSVGMPCFLMDVPTIVSFILPKLITKIKPKNIEMIKEKIYFSKDTQAVGIISMEEENPRNWIEAGEKFQSLFLLSCQVNLGISIHAASIETEMYKEVQKLLNINTRPVLFFRIGKCASKQKLSPRLSVLECLKA